MNEQETMCPDIPVNDCELGIGNQRIWVITYDMTGGKGCAVVKAPNAKIAEQILKKEGAFNAYPQWYKIIEIQEVIPSPAPMLLCEQFVPLGLN